MPFERARGPLREPILANELVERRIALTNVDTGVRVLADEK
jgi:hypothetical protein